MKAVLYLRVSTKDQDTGNQRRELEAAATRLGHTIVGIYEDRGISGSKGRDKRPQFDRMHKDVSKFDLIMAWSVDRLGRSLPDLVNFLQHLHATKTGLYLHQQGLDTTTPAGRAMFGMLAIFAEFERSIIVERVNAGLARARERGTKSGKAIGRPGLHPETIAAIRAAAGTWSQRELAARFNVSKTAVVRALAG